MGSSSLNWGSRTCLQKATFILSVITVILVTIALICNIIGAVTASEDTWFTQCEDCKGNGGEEECVKCCHDCTWRDEFMYYILRIYSMFFCLLAIAAEFPALKFLRKVMLVFKYFWGRGILQVFIGFLTIQGRLSPDDDTGATFIEIMGWIVIAFGLVHCCLACCCVQEYGEMTEEEQEEQRRQKQMANAAPQGIGPGAAPPTAAAGAGGAYAVDGGTMGATSGSNGGGAPPPKGYAI